MTNRSTNALGPEDFGGYDHDAGMSNRAVAAYSAGRQPLSRWTAVELRRGGWKHTLKLAQHLAKTGLWRSAEWHHSGGTYFNRIAFYDVNQLVDRWSALAASEQQKRIAECSTPSASAAGVKVEGTYTVFETRWRGRRPRQVEVGEQEFTGVKRGAWIYCDGDGDIKKKASGKHLRYRIIA